MRTIATAPSVESTWVNGVRRGLFGVACVCVLGFVAFLGSGAPSAVAAPVFDHDFGTFVNPRNVTVNQSTGEVYVIDAGAGNIQKFDADGNPLDFSALSSNVLDGAGAGEADQTPQDGFEFFTITTAGTAQIAIDESGGPTDGDLYVTNPNDRVVSVFSSTGAYEGEIKGSGIPFFQVFFNPCGATVDSDGNLYIGDTHGGGSLIEKYTPSGATVAEDDWDSLLTVPSSVGNICNLAADASDGLYAVADPSGPLMKYDMSTQFSSEVPSNAQTGLEVASIATTVAVNIATGDVYADRGNQIAQYNSSGLLLGTFASSDLFESNGVAINSVTGNLYATDSLTATAKLFIPPPPAPPTLEAQHTTHVHANSATLTAEVSPQGHATAYRAEYGSAGPCSIPASACTVTSDSSAGLGFDNVLAAQKVTGLSPDTTYYYRLVATNAHGSVSGPDFTFRTYPSSTAFELPEGRAYERVSPEDTNGYPVVPTGTHSVPPGGNKVLFNALGGTLPGTGSGSGTDTLRASRGPDGWSSKSLIPDRPIDSSGIGNVPKVFAASQDLSKSIFSAPAALTPDSPPVVPVPFGTPQNLYLSDASGTYRVLNPLAPDGGYMASTPDLSHIVYSAFSPPIIDPEIAPSTSYPYEWVEGSGPRLVAVLPDGSVPPSGASVGGPFSSIGLQRPISEDGARIFFRVETPGHSSAGGGFGGGDIYARVNGSSTVHVSASQRSVPDPDGPQPATFLQAEAAHGNKALFTSCEKLTDDSTASAATNITTGEVSCRATAGGKDDLYLYDFVSGDLTDLTVADPSGADVVGLVGASDDLSRIYFVATGDLAPGPSPGGLNLFLWDEGVTTFVATLEKDGTVGDAVQDSYNWSSNVAQSRSRVSRVSPNGQFLLVTSRADLVPHYDNAGPECTLDASFTSIGRQCSEVYRYDAVADRLECLSCPASGINSDGDAALVNRGGPSFIADTAELPMNLLNDGTAYFETPTKLVAEDSNSATDVYQFRSGELRLISSGSHAGQSHFADATSDGSDVFFTTTASLVGSDRGSLVDLYDARVGGGFPEVLPPQGCEGDACAPPPIVPNTPTPGSSTYRGPGNPVVKKKARCAKDKVRRKGRCVKKQKKPKSKTSHNRRASR